MGSVDVSLEESGADGLGGLGVFADLGERELNRTEREWIRRGPLLFLVLLRRTSSD